MTASLHQLAAARPGSVPVERAVFAGLERQRLPHFFIVGAPKCGTTALHSYLQEHPGAFLASDRAGRKFEPQFFCTDFPGIAHFHSSEDYQALFDHAPPDALRGESSPWYLYSQVAAANLREHAPDAKLIVLLRNPVDMAHSLHGQLLLSLREDVEDFEIAWQLQETRRRGEALPRHCREPAHLQYGAVCSFARQLERLFQHVPRERVQVVLFEDLVTDPARTYRSILEFLGLPDDGRTTFAKVNGSSSYRNRAVIGALNHLPRGLDPLLYRVKRAANRSGIRPLRLLKRINAQPQSRAPLSPAFRRHLEAYFQDDVRWTERIIGRSLEPWGPRPLAA